MKRSAITILGLSACFIPVVVASADSIAVSGRITNMTEDMPRTITINECDISDKSATRVCRLDENGCFSSKIPLSYPHTFTLNYNIRNFVNAYASPGDSVFLDIDAGAQPLAVSFSGDNAELNQQYNQAFQDLKEFYYSVSLPASTTPIDEFLPVFKAYVKAGQDSIECYARHHEVSDEVKSMLYADQVFSLANMA